MKPLLFVWPIGAVFWAAWLWAFVPEIRIVRAARREQRALSRAARDPSLQPLLLGQQVTMLLALALALTVPSLAVVRDREAWFLLGAVLVVLASLLRRHCFRLLGADFRGAVTVRSDQPLVERGAYRWVRHPSYVAGLVFLLAFGVALGNWGSLLVLLLGGALAYGYRIRVEERALVATLGAPYVAYQGRTARLIPGVW